MSINRSSIIALTTFSAWGGGRGTVEREELRDMSVINKVVRRLYLSKVFY